MLLVRAIKKYHDEKGLLWGYIIQQEGTSNVMTVHKDQLKQAVKNGQCKVVNMTLTSDGRFIGKAAPAPKPKKNAVKRSGMKVIQLWTCGRDIVGAMVDANEYVNSGAGKLPQLKGLNENAIIEIGSEALRKIASGGYDNIVLGEDKKPDLKASGVSRNSFSKVRGRLIKVLDNNDVKSKLVVKKVSKDEFGVIIESYDALENAGLQTIINIYKCLAIFAIKNGTKWKVAKADGNMVVFYGPENVTEAKTILKSITETK